MSAPAYKATTTYVHVWTDPRAFIGSPYEQSRALPVVVRAVGGWGTLLTNGKRPRSRAVSLREPTFIDLGIHGRPAGETVPDLFAALCLATEQDTQEALGEMMKIAQEYPDLKWEAW